MEPTSTKEKFIHRWGELCTNWGAHRNQGLVQGLLLVSPDPLDCDQIAKEISLSVSCVKAQLKHLEDWKLVDRVKEGSSRKVKFQAEKNVWRMFQLIVKHRKERELDPMLELLQEICKESDSSRESREVQKLANDFYHFSAKADKALDRICDLDESLIARTLFRLSGV